VWRVVKVRGMEEEEEEEGRGEDQEGWGRTSK
jgi:hypothetical protein